MNSLAELKHANIALSSPSSENAALRLCRSVAKFAKNIKAAHVKEFGVKAGVNIAAGALTKLFVGAALAGVAAPAVVSVAVTAVSVAAVTTKITHWRDCKKAIQNNEPPPQFTWKNYGLKGLFSTAMAGFGALFSTDILNIFTPDAAHAYDVTPDMQSFAPVSGHGFYDEVNFNPGAAVGESGNISAASAESALDAPPTVPWDVTADNAEQAPPKIQVTATNQEVLEQQAWSTANSSQPVPFDFLNETYAEDIVVNDHAAPNENSALQHDSPEVPAINPIDALNDLSLTGRAEVALDLHLNGSAQGTADLGYYYLHGEQGVPQDYEMAVQLYREAAEAGNTYALRDLAYVEARAEAALGHEIEKVPLLEVQSLSESSPINDQSVLAEFSNLENWQDRAQSALDLHLDGKAQGTADLGYYYLHGEQGVPQDYEMAVQLYREAAEAGNTYALRDLAYVENMAKNAGIMIDAQEMDDVVINQGENMVPNSERASCYGQFSYNQYLENMLQYDCDIKGDGNAIYPGEHVAVYFNDSTIYKFSLDATASPQDVQQYIQDSVLPIASENYGID